jgi:AGZA family xanthine/uracil permease-like MFS transporter
MALKKAIGIGIGLFLAFIGLVDAGFVSRNVAGPVPVRLGTEGFLSGFGPVLFASTVLFTAWLVARGVKAGLLLGMAAATALALVADRLGVKGGVALPSALVSLPDFSQLGRFDLGFASALGAGPAALVVFSLMLSDFFDTVGTVVAVGQEARYLDAEGNFPRPGAVLLVDSLAAVAGGAAGCSSATTYIESASGAAAGGRTGLASVVTGLLFALGLFIAPLAGVVPAQATGAVLVVVGFFMMRDVGAIPWDDATEAIPAFLTLIVMPFTYSITNGVGAGFISYVCVKALSGRRREVHPLLLASAAAFLAYFVLSRF